MIDATESSSTRPYLIRAMYEWCTDNGLTPYLAVQVDDSVQVPREYVKNGEIVLNVSVDATSALKLGNEFVEFKARFAGSARDILVPVGRVIAVYARENGQGMAFPPPRAGEDASGEPRALLRDASRSAPSEGDGRAMRLVSDEAAGNNPTDAPETDPPPRPPTAPGGGKRPALKRVK